MASFRKLMDNLAELSQVPSRIAADVSHGINELIAEQFAQGKDAYGKPWKPLLPSTIRRKKGDDRILLDTDHMSQVTLAKPSKGAGIAIATTDYAAFHQTGTKHMVPREVLPDRSDLPLAWQKVIEEAASKAVKKVLQ